ncbi:MAG: carbohydrate kinase family protein [Sulfitobacter sp.]
MIICCGEALIDMIPSMDPTGQQAFTPHAGGAVFNTAIALGRLGAPVGFVSGISTDLFGDILLQGLKDSNVETGNVMMSDRRTTLAFVTLKNGQASYLFFDENSAGRMLDAAQLPAIPDSTSALYFGGISLINAPAADFYVALAMREAGKRVIMADPNIRMNFVTDEDEYRARLARLIAHTDILKVSDEDLDWIVPGPLSLLEKADKLLLDGPQLVIVTRGSQGAVGLFGTDNVVEVPARRTTVADTVGAGDTFNSGVLAELSNQGLLSKAALENITEAQVTDALAMGAKVAGITVSRPGANPPWAHELIGT